ASGSCRSAASSSSRSRARSHCLRPTSSSTRARAGRLTLGAPFLRMVAMPFLLDLARPWAILLLIPALALVARATRGSVVPLSRAGAWLVLALRVSLVTALVLVAAGARSVRPRDEVDVVFCVDVSASIPRRERERALDWAKQAARSARGQDRSGLVLFGE